jgi:hypothetical protein
MRFSLGFLLFLVLAVLLIANGMRAFVKGGENAVPTGIVSLLAAAGIAFAGYYMFLFWSLHFRSWVRLRFWGETSYWSREDLLRPFDRAMAMNLPRVRIWMLMIAVLVVGLGSGFVVWFLRPMTNTAKAAWFRNEARRARMEALRNPADARANEAWAKIADEMAAEAEKAVGPQN